MNPDVWQPAPRRPILRTVAWLTGVLVFLCVLLSQQIALEQLGLRMFIDLGNGYDGGPDGALTASGWALAILNLMFSARVGMAIYCGHWRGGMPKEGDIDFLAWTYGLIIFAFMAGSLDMIVGYRFGIVGVSKTLFEIALVCALAKVMYDWRKRRLGAARRNQ